MGVIAEIVNNQKKCRFCLEWIDISLFGTFLDKKKTKNGKWVASKRYVNSRCRKCSKYVTTLWAKKNKERISERWKNKKENLLKQIREHYGNKCACCAEENPLFLTIDHINNDGYKLRPRNKSGDSVGLFSGTFYQRIIQSGFPSDLQLLCWNCNCGKHRNKGICPHQKQ
jgi:hypothetical protein